MSEQRYEVMVGLMSNPYEWLMANGRQDHLIGTYDILDRLHPPRMRLVVVVNNRDTALMLKLALG